MTVSATSAAGASSTSSTQNGKGLNGLSSEAFLQMMITQLQNQDPLEPTGNDELLNQISQMRSLQSNIELGETLTSITNNQQLSSAASFIGKTITASVQTAAGSRQVSGVVTRAFVAEGQAFIGVGDDSVPVSGVHTIHQS